MKEPLKIEALRRIVNEKIIENNLGNDFCSSVIV